MMKMGYKVRFCSIISVLAMLMLVFSVSVASAESVVLVENGNTKFVIVHYNVPENIKGNFSPINPLPYDNYDNIGYESFAATELAKYLKKISGVTINIVEVTNKDEVLDLKPYIAIGRLAKDLGAFAPKSKFEIDGHVIEITKDKILLAGEQPLSSYYAVNHLLEMIGCRWYMPGELGEVIPNTEKITFKIGKVEEVPDLFSRHLWYSGMAPYSRTRDELDRLNLWSLRNRQFGVQVHMGHFWNRVIPRDKYFAEHPEWFALINGERSSRQLCTTNKQLIAEFTKNYKDMIRENPEQNWWSLSPNDGARFCECENCTVLDPGMDIIMSNRPQITDRLAKFFNAVVKDILDEFPDKYFAFYAYVNHLAPPTREKFHPHIIPVVTPIWYSRYHEMDSPNSETMHALARYVEQWSEQADSILYYGYSSNLADHILTYTKEHQTRHDWPFMYKNKLVGICMESQKRWADMVPWYYLMARLNLNMEANSDDILDDFYDKFFGDSAEEMKEYLSMLSQAYADLTCEVGNMWTAHLVFTPDFMDRAKVLLDRANEKAGDDQVTINRIRMYIDSLHITELFLESRKAVLDIDFPKASNFIEEMVKYAGEVYERNPEAISLAPFYETHLVNFWKKHIDFSAQKLESSHILFAFPDEWYAFPDFSGIGEIGELYNPQLPLDRWLKLKTYTKTISEQGLSRFRGDIWYRQSAFIGSQYRGQKICLLMTGIDHTIKLYVNGQYVGQGVGGTFNAFDFDVTEFINYGENNTFVLDVNNESISDLETGGIMRPVVLYSPHMGAQVIE